MNYFITGANRGLGYELVKTALEQSGTVVATVRKPLKDDEPLTALKQKYNDQLKIVEMDVADEASVKQAAEQVQQEVGSIDIIINNAGVIGGRGENATDITIDDVQYCFNINVLGPIRVVKYFLPVMPSDGKAAIINISSDAGSISHTGGGDYAYGISKAALNMYTAQLDREVKEKDIYVAAIHPGWMQTDMGGDKAPLVPSTSAEGILSLIKNRKQSAASLNYFDYSGKEMYV